MASSINIASHRISSEYIYRRGLAAEVIFFYTCLCYPDKPEPTPAYQRAQPFESHYLPSTTSRFNVLNGRSSSNVRYEYRSRATPINFMLSNQSPWCVWCITRLIRCTTILVCRTLARSSRKTTTTSHYGVCCHCTIWWHAASISISSAPSPATAISSW